MSAGRGPIPKRSATRRRRNLPSDGLNIVTAPGAENIVVPEPDEDWHDIAYDWFLSLAESGMAAFYEPSDWMTAYLTAQVMSDYFSDQFLGFQVVGPAGRQEAYYGRKTLTGSELAGLLKAMSNLGATEGDRRRMRIELERGSQKPGETETQGQSAVSNVKQGLSLMQGGKSA